MLPNLPTPNGRSLASRLSFGCTNLAIHWIPGSQFGQGRSEIYIRVKSATSFGTPFTMRPRVLRIADEYTC